MGYSTFTKTLIHMAAVGSERISAVVGYIITKGDFRLSSPNLPQQIEVFAEANSANQSGLDITRWRVTSLSAAGTKYGYGSPIYHALRILFPKFSDGVGGIPVYVTAQTQAGGATAKVYTITPTGTATENATHTLIVAGRDNIDAQSYSYTVQTGDTATQITAKISDVINSVLGCPFIGAEIAYEAILTSKWKGLTANDLTISIDNGGKAAGITYSTLSLQSGAGTPSIASALTGIGNNWSTIGINGYGLNTTVLSSLEAWNGIPDADNPTGRYVGTVMKPMIWLSGSVLNDPSSITDPRAAEVTNSVSPAPLSPGLPIEAAANDAVVFALISQNTPNLDILNKFAPDMPSPLDAVIGSMASYNERDRIVKLGCSTVDFVSSKYQYKDPVTTYHPEGEIPPQYRYRRDLMIDFNIRYGYLLLEQTNVVAHQIANDTDIVNAANVIKPKQWKQVLGGYFDDLVSRGLIVDAAFSKASLSVTIDSTNPNRLNTSFRVKRSGVARISATTAETGFNFGSIGS